MRQNIISERLKFDNHMHYARSGIVGNKFGGCFYFISAPEGVGPNPTGHNLITFTTLKA